MCFKDECEFDNATDIAREVDDKDIPQEIIDYANNYQREKGEKITTYCSIWCYSEKCKEIYLRTFAFKNKGDEKQILEVLRTAERIQINRNVYYTNMGGWHTGFPNDVCKHYYWGYGNRFELEQWEGRTNRFINAIYGHICCKYIVKNIMEENYPYLFKKFPDIVNQTPVEMFKILKQYRKSTQIEWLLEKGLLTIAKDKRINTMRKSKKMELVKFLQNITDEEVTYINSNGGLSLVLSAMKNKCTVKQMTIMNKFGINSTKDYEYIMKKKLITDITRYYQPKYRLYTDYLGMCEKNGHDITQDYWRYPKSIEAFHERMMQENNYIESFENNVKFGEGLKRFEKMSNTTYFQNDKYKIFIPYEYEKFEKQAEVLYQCIIRNGYIEKMVEEELLLVFITDLNDTPIATAELDYKCNIGQFYADERDRKKCLPSDEVKELFKDWIAKNKKNIKKPYGKKFKTHYFKGFFDEELSSMFNKKYKIGEVFDTGVSDEEFTFSCKSTKKAVHFCKNIRSIKNFINAKCICEIEPLGKVLNVGEEYFSNKIKIVRVIDNIDLQAA